MLERFKQMWLHWQGVTAGILFVQNAILMLVAYVAGVGPVAIGFRVLGRKLIDTKPADPSAASYWVPRSGKPQSMDEANRMF